MVEELVEALPEVRMCWLAVGGCFALLWVKIDICLEEIDCKEKDSNSACCLDIPHQLAYWYRVPRFQPRQQSSYVIVWQLHEAGCYRVLSWCSETGGISGRSCLEAGLKMEESWFDE